MSFHDPSTNGRCSEYRLETSILRKRAFDFPFGFGLGFEIRRGDDDVLKFAIYLGPLASFWLTFNNRFLRKWLAVRDDQPASYFARKYGIQIWPYTKTPFHISWGEISGYWSRDLPRRSFSSNDLARILFGKIDVKRTDFRAEDAVVEMSEGSYPARVHINTINRRYTKWLGKFVKLRSWDSYEVTIPGGIPHMSKYGDMDGLFSLAWGGAKSVDELLTHTRDAVLRDRERFGPKEPPPRVMNVNEAETWRNELRKAKAWTENQ